MGRKTAIEWCDSTAIATSSVAGLKRRLGRAWFEAMRPVLAARAAQRGVI